uniref:NADH-ubiquinone oxidoreductase chain 4 n=1 Tax=Tetrastichus howardi TaxID=2848231 RepID=A0A8F5GEU2_9HYME|nr:NADH dehydrogenase subunit 4 [Tetrastichus howardi]QXM14789.1 NADH dehydrogenase subunit 4 [Tetrastichus howardi]
MMKMYMYMIMLIIPIINMKFFYLNMFMFNMIILFLFFMILMFNFSMFYNNIYYWMGLDLMMFALIMLSIFIIGLMFFTSMNIEKSKIFSLLLLLLLLSLLLSFSSMNYFMFYLFFEISLLPTFILIMMFGYQPERINASMYMILYTMFASLPLLLLIFFLNKMFYSLNYYFMFKNLNYLNISMLMFYIFMIFAFLVKLPMFMFHMWLPKAHVEAPISGSMILAGVMLKLGGYGLYRSMNMMLKLCKKFNIYLIILNLIGIFMLSILCLRQNDLKMMVAYSSVVHMSMMLISLMTLTNLSKYSMIFMMIGHGFCSPGLFILVNYIYIRSKSRNLYLNKGMVNIFPSMMLWWFLFCIGNLGAPMTLNFLSELFIIMVLLNWSMKLIYLMIILMIFCSSYSLYLFSSIFHGNLYSNIKNFYSNKINEFLLMFMLWLPMNLYVLKMDLLI